MRSKPNAIVYHIRDLVWDFSGSKKPRKSPPTEFGWVLDIDGPAYQGESQDDRDYRLVNQISDHFGWCIEDCRPFVMGAVTWTLPGNRPLFW